MKRFLSMALCLVMIVSVLAVFTACGGSDSGNNANLENNADQLGDVNNGNEDQQEETENLCSPRTRKI